MLNRGKIHTTRNLSGMCRIIEITFLIFAAKARNDPSTPTTEPDPYYGNDNEDNYNNDCSEISMVSRAIYVTGDEEVEGVGGRVSCGVGVLEPLSVVEVLVVEAVVAGAGRAETIEHQHHKSNIANTFRKMCRTMTTRLPSNFWQVTTSAGNHYIHTFWEAQVRLNVGNE